MAARKNPAATPAPQPGTAVEEVGTPLLLPDEDPALYQSLRATLMSELRPATPYERALAENLVMLEWEMARHRRLRDSLLVSKYKQEAKSLFQGLYGDATMSQDDAKALVGTARGKRRTAENRLSAHGCTPSEFLAEAHRRFGDAFERHERRLSELETRRRRLREDYDRLQARRPQGVEEAEIVDAAAQD